MIRIHVVYQNHILKKVTIFGHAKYEDYGKDIVCAAVSATYLCTVNGILKIDKNSISVISNDLKQEIVVNKNNDVILNLLQNMVECFIDLERQYPNNIKLDLDKEE